MWRLAAPAFGIPDRQAPHNPPKLSCNELQSVSKNTKIRIVNPRGGGIASWFFEDTTAPRDSLVLFEVFVSEAHMVSALDVGSRSCWVCSFRAFVLRVLGSLSDLVFGGLVLILPHVEESGKTL